MRQRAAIQHVARPGLRLSIAAAIAISLGAALSAGTVQGRVAPTSARSAVVLSEAIDAKVTGGGTVVATPGFSTAVASFGLNAKLPPGFTNGAATGRINYD